MCEGHVILDSYVISFESKTSSAFEWEHQSCGCWSGCRAMDRLATFHSSFGWALHLCPTLNPHVTPWLSYWGDESPRDCWWRQLLLEYRHWHESIDCCGEGEHYTCTVKARSVGVWRQISDMASFWIRPEYVVDYRPILDAPVDAAGEVVEEIMLYCCWCIRWCRTSAIIAMRWWWHVVALYFLQLLIFGTVYFWSHLWKL